MSDEKVFDQIKESLIRLDEQGVLKATQDAITQGFSSKDIISKGLVKAMEVIGERFEKREVFLPELILSAKVMEAAYAILKGQINGSSVESKGKVLLGTAHGDVHDIGKNILSAVLQGDGFEVYDLGVDVPPEEFLVKVKEINPDIVGISALISTGVSGINETIMILKENNIPVKIAVGGAAMTPETMTHYPPLAVTLQDGSPVVLRPLQPTDGEALTALYAGMPREDARFYGSCLRGRELALAKVALAESPCEVVLVLETPDGGIGGYARYRWEREQAEKSHFGICISRPYQSAGAGRALMTRLLEIARTIGPPVMCLTVQLANVRAVKLYTRMGFQVVREQMCQRDPSSEWLPEPEYYMEQRIR